MGRSPVRSPQTDKSPGDPIGQDGGAAPKKCSSHHTAAMYLTERISQMCPVNPHSATQPLRINRSSSFIHSRYTATENFILS